MLMATRTFTMTDICILCFTFFLRVLFLLSFQSCLKFSINLTIKETLIPINQISVAFATTNIDAELSMHFIQLLSK